MFRIKSIKIDTSSTGPNFDEVTRSLERPPVTITALKYPDGTELADTYTAPGQTISVALGNENPSLLAANSSPLAAKKAFVDMSQGAIVITPKGCHIFKSSPDDSLHLARSIDLKKNEGFPDLTTSEHLPVEFLDKIPPKWRPELSFLATAEVFGVLFEVEGKIDGTPEQPNMFEGNPIEAAMAMVKAQPIGALATSAA